MFSARTASFQKEINPLYQALARKKAAGEKVIDLICGNDFFYPPDLLEAALREGKKQGGPYRPDPLGQPVAREAIHQYYLDAGLTIPSDQIVITPGTSLSYSDLFHLLADPGDEILSPSPGYPLFDTIADLCGIRMVPYLIREQKRWAIDLNHLESGVTDKTRAMIVISPHNPTGSVASEEEIQGIDDIAGRHHLPVIFDEVFGEFLFSQSSLPRSFVKAPLVVRLNGFSKMFALPGMKIGWMALSGEVPLVEEALTRLAGISDTFLPVNEMAQWATPALFQNGKGFLSRYVFDVKARREQTLKILDGISSVSYLPPEGGFYLTVRINDSKANDEKVALDLLQERNVLVHPGFLYELNDPHFVMNYAKEGARLEVGLQAIARHFGYPGLCPPEQMPGPGGSS